MANTPRADAPRSTKRGLLAAILAAILALPALAGEPAPVAEAEPEALPPETPVLAAGLLVVVDPETGEIVDQPTQAQIRAVSESLARSLDRSDAGLVRRPIAGGGWIVDLEGRFRHALVARPAGDGGFELLCPDQAEEAAELLTHPPEPRWEEK